MVGKDKYIISSKEELDLYICIFDEKLNKYINSIFHINLENNDTIIRLLYLLKNNNVVVFTYSSILIYEFNQNNNNLNCIKKFLGMTVEKDCPEFHINVHELKNNDFIFNFSKKMFCISGITYEIKFIINFNHIIHKSLCFNNEILVDNGHFNLKNLKFFIDEICQMPIGYYKFKKIDFILYDKYFELKDSKSSLLIYTEEFMDSYYFSKLEFIIFDKKENVFVIYSYNDNIMTFKIYKITNN